MGDYLHENSLKPIMYSTVLVGKIVEVVRNEVECRVFAPF